VADRAWAKDPGQAERDQAGTADLEEWSWTGAGPTQAHPKRRMSGTWPGARVAVEVLAACALALQGLIAIFENEFYVQTRNYLFEFDATTWGWIHLVIGLLVAFAGWGLLSGQTWARVVGITLAALSATANFLFIPYYPFWSLLIITLNIFVIWALTAHGREYRELKDAEAEYRMHR
jgi:hypothetical protein